MQQIGEILEQIQTGSHVNDPGFDPLFHAKISEAIEQEFTCSDVGNAQRLVHYFGDKIRYNYTNKRWHIWNGKIWEKDDAGKIKEFAKQLPRIIGIEANSIPDEWNNKNLVKELHKHAAKSLDENKINSAINLAKTDTKITISQTEFDSDPYLICVNNGVLNFRDIKFIKHDPKLYLSKMATVDYDKKAQCPLWIEFLNKIFNNNQEMIDFLARAIGYSLTGSTGQRVFFVCYGCGANGKSTFIGIIERILGDYAKTTPFSTFLSKKYEGIPNDIAALDGIRFVSASEGESTRSLNESLIKRLTGDIDKISARFMRAEFFEFKPQFKIWLHTNHKPNIRGTDEAIWDRVKLIPFNVRIPLNERIPEYYKILETEFSGILNWALKGFVDFNKDKNLRFPEEVNTATKSYQLEEDLIGQFIQTCCTTGEYDSCRNKELYDSYKNWYGDKPMHTRTFCKLLRERGFESEQKRDGLYWYKLGIKSEEIEEEIENV